MQSRIIISNIQNLSIELAKERLLEYSDLSESKEVFEVNEDKSIGIDVVRQIKSYISVKPLAGEHKVIIVWHAEKLTIPAQNAFLKIIEEPADFVQIILQTQNPSTLIETIRSRCLVNHFLLEEESSSSLDSSQLSEVLNKSYAEKISFSDTLSKDKEKTTEWLNQSISILRQVLRQSPSKTNLYNLMIFLYGLKLLKQNINLKLVIDTVLLKSRPLFS